jgi:hypothetical protein
MDGVMEKPAPAGSGLRKPSFLDTVRTVLAGAIGIRRRQDHERAPLNPLHLIAAALLFVVLFIFTLLTIVRIVLG